MRAVSFSFIWGLTENYTLRVIATQMTLRSYSKEENGGARTHVILAEGDLPSRKHLRRTLLLVPKNGLSQLMIFSALLRK